MDRALRTAIQYSAMLKRLCIALLMTGVVNGCTTVEEREKQQQAYAERVTLQKAMIDQYCSNTWSKLEKGMSNAQVKSLIGTFTLFGDACNSIIKHREMTLTFDRNCTLESWSHVVCPDQTPSTHRVRKTPDIDSQPVPPGFRSDAGEWRKIYQKVTNNFSRYADSRLKINAKNSVVNGAIAQVNIEMENTSGTGSLYLFIEANDEPFAVKYRLLQPNVLVYATTRLRMQRSGDLLAVFTNAEGKVIASRKRINITIPASLKPATGAGFERVRAHARQIGDAVQLKALIFAPMGTNNYINEITILDGDAALVDVFLSPAVSKNPYFTFRINTENPLLSMRLKSVDGDHDQSWPIVPITVRRHGGSSPVQE